LVIVFECFDDLVKNIWKLILKFFGIKAVKFFMQENAWKFLQRKDRFEMFKNYGCEIG
jgi:hypothetical protein